MSRITWWRNRWNEPRSAEAIGRLGMLYHAYRFLDEARTSYRIAHELAPDDFRFVYYAAKLEKTAFAYEAAEALFRSAIAMKPGDAELWAELGDLYLMWNRREDAETHLGKARGGCSARRDGIGSPTMKPRPSWPISPRGGRRRADDECAFVRAANLGRYSSIP